MTDKISLKDFLWLVGLYVLSIIPFTRRFFQDYEEQIRLLEIDNAIANSVVKFERAAKVQHDRLSNRGGGVRNPRGLPFPMKRVGLAGFLSKSMNCSQSEQHKSGN